MLSNILKILNKETIKSDLTVYGQDFLYRDYTDYPDFLPLFCHYEHGLPFENLISLNSLDNAKYLFLAANKSRAKLWREKTNLKMVIAGPAFINYRIKNKITIDADAKGTIAFPAHSQQEGEHCYDIEEYCNLLKNLPEKFQPVTINLYINDILRGKDLEYKKHGFDVITAGDVYGRDFAPNLYNNLKKHKYATGNIPGSQVFYCLEMGIPFFLMGKAPIFKIEQGVSLDYFKDGKKVVYAGGEHNLLERDYMRDLAKLLPNEPTDHISKELEEYVDEMVAKNDKVSPDELRKILIWSFIINLPAFLVKNLKNSLKILVGCALRTNIKSG